MEEEIGEFIYCDMCGYVPVQNSCEHIVNTHQNAMETNANTDADIADVTYEERLISLVECRPPLWDTRLSVTDRSKGIRETLWLEIYNCLQKEYPIEWIQKKWRNLRDTFIKRKAEMEEYTPSGSASTKKKVWKHYEMLRFLSDTIHARKTVSTLDNTNLDSTESTSSNPRRKWASATNNKVDDAFIDAIQAVQSTIASQGTQSDATQINPICIRISQILDTLDDRTKAKLELELLTKTYSVAFP